MNHTLVTFDDFVDDLLTSDINLLKAELDLLIIQELFQSLELNSIKDNELNDNNYLAAWLTFMKFLYEKFWVPFFGGILSKLVFLIEGKPQKLEKPKKDQ